MIHNEHINQYESEYVVYVNDESLIFRITYSMHNVILLRLPTYVVVICD